MHGKRFKKKEEEIGVGAVKVIKTVEKQKMMQYGIDEQLSTSDVLLAHDNLFDFRDFYASSGEIKQVLILELVEHFRNVESCGHQFVCKIYHTNVEFLTSGRTCGTSEQEIEETFFKF